MSIVGPLLALAAFMAAVVLLLAIVAAVATAARIGRDRRETHRLVRDAEAMLRQAAGNRQDHPNP